MQQWKNLLVNYSLLFVGFGLHDQYVMSLLVSVLESFGCNLSKHYALLKKKDDGEARKIWQRFNIQAIDFEDYGPPLVSVIQEIARHANEPPGGKKTNKLPVRNEGRFQSSLSSIRGGCKSSASL